MRHKMGCAYIDWRGLMKKSNVYVSRRKILSSAAGMTAVLALGGIPGLASAQTTLKLSETLPLGFPTADALVEMADKINALPGGSLKIQMYPGGQLGNEKETTEQTQLGAIQLNRISVAIVASIVDDLNVLSLPYLFKDTTHMERVIDGPVGDLMLDKITNHPNSRLVGLAWMGAGSRNIFTTKRKVSSVADLHGLKIRITPNPIFADAIKAMGASPVPMGFGDVYTGLQTGMLDGADGAPPTIVSASLHTVTKYFTPTAHVIVPDILVMSRRAWDRLSKEEQQLIKTSAKETQKRQRVLWNAAEAKSLEIMKAGGMEIVEFSDQAKLRELTAPVRENHGKQYKDLIARIKAES